MKEIFTIQQADNGIILKTDDSIEVIEETNNPSGKGEDHIFLQLGKFFYGYIKYAMNEELSNKVKIEINITQINTEYKNCKTY